MFTDKEKGEIYGVITVPSKGMERVLEIYKGNRKYR